MTTLGEIRTAGRGATREEQAKLVRYVGWGGLPQAFDPDNKDWQREYHELRSLLSPDDYDAARRSTQDAHYTAKGVIDGIYQALGQFGVQGGKFHEPAAGTGNFIGLMPSAMREQSDVVAVELDPTTAAIAKYLYPSATVINKGYQEVAAPSGYFDVVIGNPPFGNQRLYDRDHPELAEFSIHNYFIAKSLDKLRPGGVLAVVVSNYFLDAANGQVREHIAQSANLVGAIRLPNTAFKQNALTEVTTDIVFLQKRVAGQAPDLTWTTVGSVNDPSTGQPITLNRYFVERPEMMLGTMALAGTMYAGGQAALVAPDGQDLATAIASAVARLPAGIYSAVDRTSTLRPEPGERVEVPSSTKVGGYFVLPDGRIGRRLPDVLADTQYELVEPKSEKAVERIAGMIGVRTALRELMAAERDDAPISRLDALRRDLNRTYDAFTKRHGHLSSLPNKQAMGDDPDYPLLHSLERDYDKGISKETAKKNGVEPRAPSAAKAAIFSKRVIAPTRAVHTVESAKDALVVSMNETGRVNLDLMVRLTGKTTDEVLSDLRGLVYLNPLTSAYEPADQYLTGNVKAKLLHAKGAAASDSRFAENVEALTAVQPRDIEAVDISVSLGATWVPERYVSEFVTHVLGDVHRQITYQSAIGKWMVKIHPADRTTNYTQWGTPELGAHALLERILENRPVEVKDLVGRDEKGPIYQTNPEKTAAATQKADELRQAFKDWIWEDKERRDDLARLYNDRFNTNVAPKHNGAHLTLPGASLGITLRPHQKDAIWRGIQDGSALFDHVVGAGKTMVCIAVAMESRRMGLARKPMINVPNHLTLQWKDAFYELYPNANVLVAEKSDFQKENRKRLFARIATGDWDAVIVGHSSFKKIGMPEETLTEILGEQIDDLTDAIRKLKAKNGERMTIKQMEKARERMQAKMEKMADRGQKDDVVTFDELGVDMLLTDEMDLYKNLFINTSLDVAGLGNVAGSDMAFDLFVKQRWLQEKYDQRGVFGATGTPISNTIAEMYTLQRYFQYPEIKQAGIVHFDAWASTFGEVVTSWELDATGVNYQLKSRFSKFKNVPELVSMYRSFADVILRDDLEEQARARGTRFPVPRIAGGKPRNIVVERSALQAQYMGVQEPKLGSDGKPYTREDGSAVMDWNHGSIIHRMENLPNDPRVDNPLKITNDARKAGLDFRLINPSAPDFEGSKVNAAVAEMLRIYKKWDHVKGTQLVFCDLSTPKGGGAPVDRQVSPQQEGEDEAEREAPQVSMDELLAGGSKFSVYDDIRSKLIAAGVPPAEVRFVHEAKTDLQKAKLFAAVNSGEVRFLLGSTAKMGAGANVQKRLVAEHNLDAPWRPRDLEQREGRIIRQGNMFYETDPDGFEVEVLRYATKQTYDSRMWQTIEYKAAGIEQFRKGGSTQRVIEDVASEAANAAEMKAAATGNPLIFQHVQLSSDLRKLEAVYANHKRSLHALENRLQWLDRAEARAEHTLRRLNSEVETRDAHTTDDFRFDVGSRRFGKDDKDALLGHFVGAIEAAIREKGSGHDKGNTISVGRYRGFDINVKGSFGSVQFALNSGGHERQPGNLQYTKEDKFSVDGFFRRLDNVLEMLETYKRHAVDDLEQEKLEREKARTELGKPFGEERRLLALRKDVADVMVELKKVQADSNYVSTWEPLSAKVAAGMDVALPSDEHSFSVRGTVARVDEAARRFLQSATSPADVEQLFDSAFDALMEMGDSKEVHDLLVKRIATDELLANAVCSAPGKRFATDDMLVAAERVTGHERRALELASELGFEASAADRHAGQYVGPIVGKTERYLVQQIGQGRAVLHAQDDLLARKVDVGHDIRITYRFGAALSASRDRSAGDGGVSR